MHIIHSKIELFMIAFSLCFTFCLAENEKIIRDHNDDDQLVTDQSFNALSFYLQFEAESNA